MIPSLSANSIQVMRMCEAFALQGHNVSLIAQNGDGDDDPYEFYGVRRIFEIKRLTLCGSPRIRQWRYGRQAVSKIKGHNADVIYGRHLPSMAMASFLKRPILYEVHQPASRLGKIVESWLFRQSVFCRLITISEALRQEYIKTYPVLASKKVLACHSAANPPSSQSSAVPRSNRTRLQIGYTGHLYQGKGMEMIPMLAAQLPCFDFHVVGGTQESIWHWRGKLRNLPNIKIHGHVPAKKVADWQRQMDVLILPCQTRISSAAGTDIGRWTSPLKLFEYLASGKAVVASDLPVLREVLINGVNALLLPPEDVRAWTSTLKQLVDPRFRASLGNRARENVRQMHTWPHRAQKVLNEIS